MSVHFLGLLETPCPRADARQADREMLLFYKLSVKELRPGFVDAHRHGGMVGGAGGAGTRFARSSDAGSPALRYLIESGSTFSRRLRVGRFRAAATPPEHRPNGTGSS